MGSRGALILLSVACAVLVLVQQSEAQFGGGDNVGPFLFPENGANPIGRPPRPPRPGGSTTTRRPSVGGSGCNCPTTPEYNPVCGTDGVSYSNPAKLNCAKTCGRNVSILHYGNCTPPDPNAPTSSTTPSSTTPRRRG